MSEIAAGALVVPSHGRGLIRRGSRPGGLPGAGAPPSELRARLRGSMAERVAILEGIADSKSASDADRIRAIDTLAKYGLGTLKEISTEDVRAKLQTTIALVRQRLPAAEADSLLTEMREVWR